MSYDTMSQHVQRFREQKQIILFLMWILKERSNPSLDPVFLNPPRWRCTLGAAHPRREYWAPNCSIWWCLHPCLTRAQARFEVSAARWACVCARHTISRKSVNTGNFRCISIFQSSIQLQSNDMLCSAYAILGRCAIPSEVSQTR